MKLPEKNIAQIVLNGLFLLLVIFIIAQITALIAGRRWMNKTCSTCDWCILNFCICGKSKKREVKLEDTCKHWWQYKKQKER